MLKRCKYTTVKETPENNIVFWCKKYETAYPATEDGCWNNIGRCKGLECRSNDKDKK